MKASLKKRGAFEISIPVYGVCKVICFTQFQFFCNGVFQYPYSEYVKKANAVAMSEQSIFQYPYSEYVNISRMDKIRQDILDFNTRIVSMQS